MFSLTLLARSGAGIAVFIWSGIGLALLPGIVFVSMAIVYRRRHK